MGQCNAQTSSALSGMVSDQSTAPLSRIYTTPKEEPPSYSNLRGLDLIKSCAKYYDNGAAFHPLGEPVTRPAGSGRSSPAKRIARFCLRAQLLLQCRKNAMEARGLQSLMAECADAV